MEERESLDSRERRMEGVERECGKSEGKERDEKITGKHLATRPINRMQMALSRGVVAPGVCKSGINVVYISKLD